MPTKHPNIVKGIANLHQLHMMLIGFILIGLMLNSSGINNWAIKIPVEQFSVIRNLAIETSQVWADIANPLGLNKPRVWIDDVKLFLLSNLEKNVIFSSNKIQKVKNQPHLASPINTIALVGDSIMAVSVAPNLNRELKKLGIATVIQAYKSGTGLARPDYFNWMTEYPKLLGGQLPQIIICVIGSNDAQGFQVGNKVYQFGQPEWSEEYAKRLESFLMMLKAKNAHVYWVALPKMRSPVFDAKIQVLNKLVATHLEQQAGITLIPTNTILSPDSPNTYLEYAQDPKLGQEHLRTEDGIHLSDAGGRKLALGVISYLNRDGIFAGQDSSK